MIRHLSPESFRTFGTILPNGSSLKTKPNHHSIYLPEGTIHTYRTAAPLWLGAESGVAVLTVSADGSTFEDFYLDKAVKLKSGIWFQLVGLGGSAAVQVSGSSMPNTLGQRPNDRNFAIRPKLRVEGLYNLFYQEKEAGFVFSGEAHPMAELLYVDRGSVHSVAEGQEFLLEQGDMVLYAPEQWHMQYAEPDQAPHLVTIGFWAKGVRWEKLCNRHIRADQETRSLLRSILRSQERDEVDSIFSLLTLLLLHLQADGREDDAVPVTAALTGENTIIRKAQQYIQEHVQEKLTVPVVAQNVGVSPSYLTALFHKHLAFSPAEYIRRIKLQQSKQLIREGQMNFTQIAENLQYSTVHHFSRQFKQMFGLTPTEYAKSVK